MKDSFEKYIREHRQQMDLEEPPAAIWEKIKNDSGLGKSKDHSFLWKIAAVFFLTLSSVLAVLLYQSQHVQPPGSLGEISLKYKIIEKKYQQDINQLTSQLDLNQLDQEEYDWMMEELETLEKVNETFRKDLSRNVDQDKVVRALIDYYEKKIKLLKRIELEIKRNNNEKKSSIS